MKQGFGKFFWDNGNVYYGDFLKGKRTGKGKFTWKKSGDIYEGDNVDDSFTGKGKYTFKVSGDIYEGDFVELDFSGKGQYTWKNGNIFYGSFIRNKIQSGRLIYKSSGKVEYGRYDSSGYWRKR